MDLLPLTDPDGPIVIELAGVPVGKGRPRFVRSSGHAFTPEKTRRYESELHLAAGDAMRAAKRAPIDGPVVVDVLAYLPIPASWSGKKQRAALAGLVMPTGVPDCDNYLKAAGDALNAVVFRDDSQIVSASVSKRYSERPRLVVTVRRAA